MATFARGNLDGEACHVTLTPRRTRLHFDKSSLRILRARTFATYQAMGMTLAQIKDALNFAESTISADLAWLAEQKAAGLDRLPTDRVPDFDEVN